MAKKVKERININNINLSELSSEQLKELLEYLNNSREKGKKYIQVIAFSINMVISAITNRICVMSVEHKASAGENPNLGVVAMMVVSLISAFYFSIKAYSAVQSKEKYEEVLLDESIQQIFTSYGLEWDKLTRKEREQFHMLVAQELYDRINSDETKIKSL